MNWRMLIHVAWATLLVAMLTVILKKAVIEVLIPMFAIGVVGYLLYALLLCFQKKEPEKVEDDK
jgi:hypothetical protein